MSELNIHDQELVTKVAQNWRLTPATMATKLTRGQWIAAPWLQYAAHRVAYGIARGHARIILSAPPRHGKSELISVHTPTWVLENFPNRNVILAAYGADLAELYGRRVRDQIIDHKDQLRCRIRQDVSKVAAFSTETNGYMYSVGLGGAITGRGAHVLLIDDYIKEIKEALSPAHRNYVWDWFVTTAMTRLEPGASVIIIATRWHSDDLIGRILKNFPGQWENICLPAIALPNDILGRQPGAPLFPERYKLDYLEEQRELLGSIHFHALYQQGPIDEIAKIADPTWLKYTPTLPAQDFRWVRCWDLAATEGAGDWTTGSLCGYSRSTNIFLVANIIRRQLSPGAVELLVRNTASSDGIDTEVLIEQEPGSSGKALIHHYETTVLPEFKVRPTPATNANSKLIRAQPMLAAAEAGKVYLLDEQAYETPTPTTPTTPTTQQEKKGGWQGHFIAEFAEFPAGQYDDQVDTVSGAYAYLSGKKILSASWGRRKDNGDNKRNSKQIRKSFAQNHGATKRRRITFGR